VTSFDILRIIRYTGWSYESFAVLHQARLLSYDPDTTLDMKDDMWSYILGLRSHPCIFLKDDLCSIYGAAPLSCKRYPFRLDGKLNTRSCPLPSNLLFRLSRPDIEAEEVRKEIRLHKQIVKEWNQAPGKKSECLAFLIRKARELSGTSSG